jgi:putative transcriptional regulator
MTTRKYKNDLYESVHLSMSGLHRLSATPEFAPKDIQRLRKANKVSQPVFARYLNTSESTIEKWETGAKRPSGMALKLLAIVQKHGLQMLA